jgi:hypothetical protein
MRWWRSVWVGLLIVLIGISACGTIVRERPLEAIAQRARVPLTATQRALSTRDATPGLTPQPEPEPDPDPEAEDLIPDPEALKAQLVEDVEKLPEIVSADILDVGAGGEIWLYWEITVRPGNNTVAVAEAIKQASFNLLDTSVIINFLVTLNDGKTVPISYTWDRDNNTWLTQELISWLTATAYAAVNASAMPGD